jgi:hypothetical protein
MTPAPGTLRPKQGAGRRTYRMKVEQPARPQRREANRDMDSLFEGFSTSDPRWLMEAEVVEKGGTAIDIEFRISFVAEVTVFEGERWRGALIASAQDDVALIVEGLVAEDLMAYVENRRALVVEREEGLWMAETSSADPLGDGAD